MTRYRDAFLKAVELIQKNEEPVKAWKMALEMLDLAGKNCVNAAFVGMCTEGLIVGCKQGKSNSRKKNCEYVIKGLKYLMEHPQDADLSPNDLWVKAKIREGSRTQTGYQMDMAIVLFKHNLYDAEKVRNYRLSEQ